MSISIQSGDSSDNIPKVLPRGSACHQCRRRKLKCDAIRPICSHCSKPRIRGTSNLTELDSECCTWDEIKEPSARTRRKREIGQGNGNGNGNGSGKGRSPSDDDEEREDEKIIKKQEKLNELEERIRVFEKALAEKSRNSMASLPGFPNQLEGSFTSNVNMFPNGLPMDMGNVPLPNLAPLEHNWSGTTFDPQQQLQQAFDPSQQTQAYDMSSNFWAEGGSQTLMPDMSAAEQAGVEEMMSLIWPDWPTDLPTQDVVEHLVETFFDKVPTIPKMLHKPSFMQSLQFPPNHHKFPAVPLLHAILAAVSPYVSLTTLSHPSYYPIQTPHGTALHPLHDGPDSNHARTFALGSARPPNAGDSDVDNGISRFQAWHRRKAFEGITRSFDIGDKLLQCFQSHIIASSLDWCNGWWTDLWLESGMMIRLAIPMQLNESPNVPDDSLAHYKHSLIERASTPLEQAERDRSWWMAYYLESSVTLSCTWPSAVHSDEVTVELPVSQSMYNGGYGDLSGVQTLHSPDFYTNHPSQHVDSFCLLIKSVKLFADVNVFLRRYSRGSHSLTKYLADPSLRVLLSQINAFRLSFPPHMRRPTKVADSSQLDGDLLSAIMTTHGATLTLGEPLITKETWNTDAARMTLSAIRAILSLLYDITSTSYDIALLSPNVSFIWCLCGRGLVRFMGAATQSGDPISTSVFRSEVQVFRLALAQYSEKIPVGSKQIRILDQLIAAQDNADESSGLPSIFECPREELFNRNTTQGPSITSTPSSVSNFLNNVSASSSSASNNTPPTFNSTPTSESPIEISTSNMIYANLPAKWGQHDLTGPNATIGVDMGYGSNGINRLGSMNGNTGNTYGNSNGNVNAGGVNYSQGPGGMAMAMDMSVASEGFDIQSFSFDTDEMVSLLGGQYFDGTEFGLKQFTM